MEAIKVRLKGGIFDGKTTNAKLWIRMFKDRKDLPADFEPSWRKAFKERDPDYDPNRDSFDLLFRGLAQNYYVTGVDEDGTIVAEPIRPEHEEIVEGYP